MGFFASNATNVLSSLTLPRPTGGAYNTVRICIPEKSLKCRMELLCTWVKKLNTFAHFRLHNLLQNAFGIEPGPAKGAIALPSLLGEGKGERKGGGKSAREGSREKREGTGKG